ncbi:MAG: formate dehydrogenase subunit delta [Phenylobacterium sp.]|uniref:formate dehydrogenase subunit delta n=1 Tax=Phenylobacterium sp. TaxID=1871053 RepID=UPI0027372EDD|nr:formate dehydrogenase subunit delta [Phenylobacterium sp.]MDP3173946.1 formate dehydrogenase subunit delta [Phenylobacterium sp.]
MSGAEVDRLVTMANQIARFFESQPGDGAARATADHLNSFWAPTMREQLREHAAAGGSGLSALVAAAVPLLRPARTDAPG